MNWSVKSIGFFLLLQAGCATAADLVRPDIDSLKNGETTYSAILDRPGPPRREGSGVTDGKNVKMTAYSHASTFGTGRSEGVIPARGITFFFVDNVLVGHDYVSSWREDHTDFDAEKVKGIIKGKTTRADVIALRGKPNGYYTHPLIKPQTGDAAVYTYGELKQSDSGLKRLRKTLIATLDVQCVVTDVAYSVSGDQDRR